MNRMGTILAVLILAMLPANGAFAQEGIPTAVSQVHTYQWEWGYVGVQPMFGFWTGDRFNRTQIENPIQGGWQPGTFTQQPMFGAKISLGVGSNVDWIGTEFYASLLRQGYNGRAATGPNAGRDVTIDQWIGRIGFNMLFELVSNESITSTGEVTKDPFRFAFSIIGGFYVLFFPDSTFNLAQPVVGEDIRVTDETLWTTVGFLMDFPFSNFLTISGFAKIDFLTYRLERLELLKGLFGAEQDRGQYNFESVTERVQFSFGGYITFTPNFNTFDDHHWRFYAGVNMILAESLSPVLMISGGVNFGW